MAQKKVEEQVLAAMATKHAKMEAAVKILYDANNY
jgi:hypothetical protein